MGPSPAPTAVRASVRHLTPGGLPFSCPKGVSQTSFHVGTWPGQAAGPNTALHGLGSPPPCQPLVLSGFL